MGHTLTSKGQVTIPKAIRDRFGLETGNELEFVVNATGELVVRKAGAVDKKQAAVRKQLEKIRGSATTSLSTADIMALTRGRRI